MEKARAATVKEIFLLLSEFVKPPTPRLFASLEDLEQELAELMSETGYDENSLSSCKPESFDDLEEAYHRCFSGRVKPYAPLVESLYKPWTSDPHANLPFARSKGYLFGDSALHIRYLLDQFELQLPAAYHNTPDHLCILLELAAFGTETGEDDFLPEFLKDHFDWLNEWVQQLSKLDSTFYFKVGNIIRSFVLNLTDEVTNTQAKTPAAY
ncbi:TorD/DmsD family molecular chaperone [Bacillus marinisedimentorum]|uniref:TorD/DmsD family molecular chaperone n=1 Tax=Bacillus marinisedimentorum TaxID=1821260 RepID=UPI0007DEE20B|nr:molecular chaperone TorD family protein [Bacillus marinisedimentorum]